MGRYLELAKQTTASGGAGGPPPGPVDPRNVERLTESWRRLQPGLTEDQVQVEVRQWVQLAGELVSARAKLGEPERQAAVHAFADVEEMMRRVAASEER